MQRLIVLGFFFFNVNGHCLNGTSHHAGLLLALCREYGMRLFPHCGFFLSLVLEFILFYFILKSVSMEQNIFS